MSIPLDHRPSVLVDTEGKVVPNLGSINIATSKNKIRRIVPEETERVVKISEHKEYFKNLRFINLLLTNACNLSCAYCYEQHNRDFGRFDIQSLDKVYDWFKNINPHVKKTFSFFGGEPLIHKQLILDFLETKRVEMHEDEVARNVNFAITTNGLLLSKNFIKHYYSFPNTIMMVSLDTHLPELDHRGIGSEKMTQLLDMIEFAAQTAGAPTRFAVRATVTREGAPKVREFWEELYKRGVRQLVFHPLILSQEKGYIEWPDDEWNAFANTLKRIIMEYPDVKHIRFAEGVGMKMETNCLTGSDTIAVDASGDFSGCYFFTNRKQQVGKMMIGNILEDQLYIDRYDEFHRMYESMFENDTCKTCNYKNVCYQCPAGNISTGEQLFRPDGMCWKFVKLHNEVHDLVIQKHFTSRVIDLIKNYKMEGEIVYACDIVGLIYKYITGYYTFNEEIRGKLEGSIDYRQILGFLVDVVSSDTLEGVAIGDITIEYILQQCVFSTPMSAKDAYLTLRKILGSETNEITINNAFEEAAYISMMHLLVVDAAHPKGVKANEKVSHSS